MSCISMRGGLKSGDRVGASKKRVHFNIDEANASINALISKGDLEEDGAQTQGKACALAKGLHFQESCHVTEENSDTVKDFKNATLLCEVNVDTCAGIEKERSPSTPPPYCASYAGVPHSQLQVIGVQRKLTFGVEPSEQCHTKFVFTSKRNLSRSQNYYKVAPEAEESSRTIMNVLTPHALHLQMQANSLAYEDACKKRCAWITPQSDPVYVAYHDEEWGVPVHEDRRLFELLVFAGAQAEIAWSSLLAKREAYRNTFCQFDPPILATYDMTKVASLRSHNDIMRSEARVQSIVSNAKLVMKVVTLLSSKR